MADKSSSTRLTGGEGFNFEDKVAAYFLASMLTGSHPCGVDFGAVSQVEWQVGGLGWQLDDLLVTSAAPTSVRYSISIKSDRQVTKTGFPQSFIDAVLLQEEGPGPQDGTLHKDIRYCLAVGKLALSVNTAWQTLIRDARLGDSASIASRYTTKGGSNNISRALFSSFVAGDSKPDAATANLLKRVRLVHFDFSELESQYEARSIEICQRAVVSGQSGEAVNLWHDLIRLSATRRPAGGSLDLEGLVAELRPKHQLANRQDHSADWSILDRRSIELANAIKDSVGGRVSLIRRNMIDDLHAEIHDGNSLLLAGDGGSGKSSVAKRLVRTRHLFDRYLWLNAASLDFDSLDEVERNLGINNQLDTLLSTSTTSRSCLVIDGLEVFSPCATSRTSTILQKLGSNPSFHGWTIIATTRPQAVAKMHHLLTRSGIDSDRIAAKYIHPLADKECTAALKSRPSLEGSFIRRELRSSLQNLKVLDWIVGDQSGFTDKEIQSWTGPTEVIASLWNRWVGGDAASATRSGVMKRLGRLEGEGLHRGVGMSQLDTPELGILEELEKRDLIGVANERVWLRHDTLGDWARLRILIEESPNGSALTDYASRPRWHDAIRLYGQHLLENDGNAPQRWRDTLGSLSGDDSAAVVARDMLVEGLFCTPNAHVLIESSWPVLIEDKGLMLRRMLNRFQHAATIPDPRILSNFPDTEGHELATHWRYPWWTLWPGVLRSLASHLDDVAVYSPIEAAQVCALWLKTMPIGEVGRVDAGAVAIAIGREMQGQRVEGFKHYREQSDSIIFEAVLHASLEHPNQASALCLEMARRRPDPPEVTTRAEAYQKALEQGIAKRKADKAFPNQATLGSLIYDHGTKRERFPDGPYGRVDEALQQAVFDTQGIIILASVRPNEAKELLLACSLKPPGYERDVDMMGILERFGLEELDRMYPSMFFNGPWLPLLRTFPEVGIECIVRIVNHATTEWERKTLPPDPSESDLAATRITVQVDGSPETWIGNMRIYGWHRERFCGSHLLASALMALERYLYEQLDAEHSIEVHIAKILKEGRSVALLAVLVALVKYKKELLNGCLRNLLVLWQLHGWDQHLVLEEDTWQIGFSRWNRFGETVFNLARDWHAMPHRKEAFREKVLYLLLTDSEIQESFETIRQSWQSQIDDEELVDTSSIKLLIARFDPSNYRLSQREDGLVQIALEWPEHIKEQTEREVQHALDSQRLISFPFKCRQLLDNGEPISDDSAQTIWDEIHSLMAIQIDGEEDDGHLTQRLDDAKLGATAVLKVLATSWVDDDDTRIEWCDNQIFNILDNPPPRNEFEVEGSVSTDRWHSFMAHIAIASLASNRDDPDARWLAANSVMSYWYVTSGLALKAAYSRKAELGDDFYRLINLAVLWSALRSTFPHYDRSKPELNLFNARFNRLQSAFIESRIPSSMLEWEAISTIACRIKDRSHLRRRPDYQGPTTPSRHSVVTREIRLTQRNRVARHGPGYDIEALRHAFIWLPKPDSEDANESSESVAWLEKLLGVTLSMIPIGIDDDHEINGTPHEYDHWVFSLVATYTAQLESSEAVRSLWQPIIDLGPAAHYWVETFLSSWTVSAIHEASSSDLFFERWREMIQYAIDSDAWNPTRSNAFHLADLWQHLLGMDLGASSVAADGNQSHYSKMIPFFDTWATHGYLNQTHRLRPFLNLLTQDGARPLLCPAIPWLLHASQNFDQHDWSRDQIADSIARVLGVTWTWCAESVSVDKKLMADFVELLNILVTQQSRSAMALRDTVARSAQMPPTS